MHTSAGDTPRHRGVPRFVFYLLFTASGFAGLIYESIWSHYLQLFLGHAAYAQTLVLALFMGGMGAGAWLCSRHAPRWRNLLAAYALTEAAIGLAAFGFHPAYVALTGAAYDSWLPGLHAATGSDTLTALLKWLLSALLLLPQSVLLGMTFPLMSAGLIRRHPGGAGGTLAMLYFTNSLGAAAGVLTSGFVLIEHFGLPGTLQTAGAINLVLAVAVVVLSRPARANAAGAEAAPAPAGVASSREPPPQTLSPAHSPYGLLLTIAAFTGAASFAYEVGWIRMLTLVLGASTHSFELMLSAFILGLACGGLWIKRRIDGIAHPLRFLAVVQVVMGLAALATLPLYGLMFPLMLGLMNGLAKSGAGYLLFLLGGDGIALAIMFPAAFCAGMTLPLITHTLLRGGHGEKAIGAVYAANTLGSIAAVFAAAHLGMPLLGLKGLLACGAAIDVLLGLILFWRRVAQLRESPAPGDARIRSARRYAGWSTGVAAAAFGAVLAGVQLDRYHMASGVFRRGDLYAAGSDTHLVYYRDGKTTSVSMLDFGEDRSLRTNGKSDGAIAMRGGPIVSDEITMTLTGALPLAFKPDAQEVAVIGMGTGLTTHTLLDDAQLTRVDTIEIEPAMAEASRNFAPFNANAYADPRSNIVFDDAKTYFSTRNQRYDLIVSEPSNPWVSGVSSLFTGEFYRLARRYLKPGGVLVQWFQLYEIDLSLLASVMGALGDNFPDYAIYSSTDGDLLIVAGDRETLARPLADITQVPGLAQELARVHIHSLGDLEIRRIGGRQSLEPLFASYGAPANSDFHPFLDLHAARYRFLQQSAEDFTAIGNSGVPVVAMLEGRGSPAEHEASLDGEEYFERLALTRRAQYARDFLLRDNPPPPRAIPPALQKDLEVVKLRLVECREPARYDIWFRSLYDLAREVNPLLSVSEARSFWERIAHAPCFTSLAPVQRLWIALYAAVGTHDAPLMAQLGEALLRTPVELPRGYRQYLITAAMAGDLAQGNRAGAAQLWNSHAGDVRDTQNLGLKLLQAHAFSR